MKLTNIFKRIKQRRDLNNWLRQQRATRLELDSLSPHLRKDIGLDNVTDEPRLVWESPAKKEATDKPKKERAGPTSA